MKKTIKFLVIIAFFLLNIEVVKADTINPGTWVAIDGLGRELTTNKTRSKSHYRAVGILYWTWHLNTTAAYPFNINDFYKQYPDKKNDVTFWKNSKPEELKRKGVSRGAWWNEPIYGYYHSKDEYVLRKEAELLADARVDFVVFDASNESTTYRDYIDVLLKVWKEAKNDGVNVPKVAWMLPFNDTKSTNESFVKIYNHYYDHNSDNYKKYSDLYFRYNNKKFIMANINGASADVKNKAADFTVRTPEATYFKTGAQSHGSWGWLSTYPQAYYKKSDGTPEQITVGVAQNANYKTNQLTAMNGDYVMGRSYAKDNYSYTYTYKGHTITVGSSISGSTAKSTNTSLYGRNFQQQWDYAINIDPEVVFVTGWNEWIMGNFEKWQGVSNAFPDQFNDEYSRDIEPSKGKLKDHYYYQLVKNVRKYKGVTPQTTQNTPVTINNTSDWNNGNIFNYNHYTGGKNRDEYSSGKAFKYVNNTFRNDIKKAKVSYDSSYVYFYVETVSNLSAYNSDKWMRLLIDTKKDNNDNWEEFEYILNRVSGTTSKLILEKSNGGWSFSKVGEVDYKVTGNILEVKIRREYLGLTGNSINFNFKWCDNNLGNGDIMTLYTDGDAAPGGRFAFHFEGTSAYQKAVETVKITFDANGGSVSKTSIVINKGASYGELPTPTRSGYQFVGWFTFDYKYYADTYSDLKNAFGYNESALLTHWFNYGKSEGRRCAKDYVTKTTVANGNTTLYAIWVMNAVKKGDVNADGKINTEDYVKLRKYLLKTSTLNDSQKKNADANGDGKIDSSDYVRIRKIIMNI